MKTLSGGHRNQRIDGKHLPHPWIQTKTVSSCVYIYCEAKFIRTFEFSQKKYIRSTSISWFDYTRLQSVVWSEGGSIGNITHDFNKQSRRSGSCRPETNQVCPKLPSCSSRGWDLEILWLTHHSTCTCCCCYVRGISRKMAESASSSTTSFGQQQ